MKIYILEFHQNKYLIELTKPFQRKADKYKFF